MKRYILAVLVISAITAPTFAAEAGKVVQVIFIGRDEITGDLTYDQFDETGAARRCAYHVNTAGISAALVTLTCTQWAKPIPD